MTFFKMRIAAPLGVTGVTKNCRVAAKPLVEKDDGPTADHPIELRRIDWLKRVVPVAVPVADQLCARDEALAHRCNQLVALNSMSC